MPKYQRNNVKETVLRSNETNRQAQLPMEHTVWISTLLNACLYEGVAFYVGKYNLIGGCKLTFYLDDEKVQDFINTQDNPEERVKIICEHLFGAVVWQEVQSAARRRLATQASKAQNASKP